MSKMDWLIVIVILGFIFGFFSLISAIDMVAATNARNTQDILEKMEKMEEQIVKMEEQQQAEIDDNPKAPAELWQTLTRMIAQDETRLAELTAVGVTGPRLCCDELWRRTDT